MNRKTDRLTRTDSKFHGAIRLRGVRVHNLQIPTLDIPRNRLIVITGPSGSGKSSLAFDTLFAEGQRQYLESFSLYARQFFYQLERPDVDLIQGLPPTISIDQRAGQYNPRSTVATVTEIYDYLRLLYARVGIPHCPQCGCEIRPQNLQQILATLSSLPEGTRLVILAPLVRGRKGEHAEVLEKARKAGFLRVRIDGEFFELESVPPLRRQQRHDIEAVVDRLVIRPGIEARLAESVGLALKFGHGILIAHILPPSSSQSKVAEERLFSTQRACQNCGLSLPELEPRTFSFNSPYGACPRCGGLGRIEQFDPDAVLADKSQSLAGGALRLWPYLDGKTQRQIRALIESFLPEGGLRWDSPWKALPAPKRRQLWEGKNGHGLLHLLEEWYQELDEEEQSRWASFRIQMVCPECRGSRLQPIARSVTVGNRAIHELTALTIKEAFRFLDGLHFEGIHEAIARPILREVLSRLRFLIDVGVDYLTLDRPVNSLSGGELQRVRLASGLGAGLVGVCYILDEPSIGLHPRDSQRLMESLRRLQQQGNTVIVVEHDEGVMRQADWLIDLGPGSGKDGGRVVAEGPPDQLARNGNSLTARYLSGQLTIPLPSRRRQPKKGHAVVLEGVCTNNLKDITVTFPLGLFICVTGVSGAGKSSLVSQTLVPAIRQVHGQVGAKPGPFRRLRGAEKIDKVIEIDQTPIGRTPRSTPATYIGVFDQIRRVFAELRESRERGYKPGRFSFNVRGGRCETCQGQGQQRIEMTFLPDLYVPCPTCQGRRFNEQTLEIRYRGKNIAEVLEMRVEEAMELFENFPSIRRRLSTLRDVGLGYLTLGQPSPTLSGGEAQRTKLAAELGKISSGKSLYVFDEPTIGLHAEEIRKLLDVLNRLVDMGNTVIVIEHHLDVIKTADWVIDLGPEGGENGGRVVAVGPPEVIAACPESLTGQFLKEVLPTTAAV
jgi:excinuclease ABC subunit A